MFTPQVCRLDETIRRNDASMQLMRDDHSSQIDEMDAQLSATIERSSNQWKSERNQLEEHYNNIMSENQNRQQVTSWERMKVFFNKSSRLKKLAVQV